ncbi:hypothetical protein, partial [Bacillus thermotolerans]|uniref:hypothetical protein n=1 Tax=Bacillus thermotolerans TaxID=1221996 RepID=UPI001E31E667
NSPKRCLIAHKINKSRINWHVFCSVFKDQCSSRLNSDFLIVTQACMLVKPFLFFKRRCVCCHQRRLLI